MAHQFAGGASVAFTYLYNTENALWARTVSDAAYQAATTNPGLQPGSTAYGTVNTLNQYPQVAGATLSYDLNGNTTNDGSGGTYAYDTQSRMLRSIRGGVTTTYAYDVEGRRASKTVGSTTTRFLSAGGQEIAEYTGAGAGTRSGATCSGLAWMSLWRR